MTKKFLEARAEFDRSLKLRDKPVNELSDLQTELAAFENKTFGTQSDLEKAAGIAGSASRVVGTYFTERTAMLDRLLRMAATAGRISEQASEHIGPLDDKEQYREAMAEKIGALLVFVVSLCTNNRLDFATLVREQLKEVVCPNP